MRSLKSLISKPAPVVLPEPKPRDVLKEAQNLGGNVRRVFADMASDLKTANSLAATAESEAQAAIDAAAARKAQAQAEALANENLLKGLHALGVA